MSLSAVIGRQSNMCGYTCECLYVVPYLSSGLCFDTTSLLYVLCQFEKGLRTCLFGDPEAPSEIFFACLPTGLPFRVH